VSNIEVIQDGDEWIAKFKFNVVTKDRVKEAGFKWDPKRKCWWTKDAETAAKITEVARLQPTSAEQRQAVVNANTEKLDQILSNQVAIRTMLERLLEEAGEEPPFEITRKAA